MLGRTRGETRTRWDRTQEETHHMGFIARMSPGQVHIFLILLYKNQSTKHSVNTACHRSQHLSTSYVISDLPTPPTVKEVDESNYAEIWRNSKVCEFGGLLQAYTFKSA